MKLFDFAIVSDWESRLSSLAQMAEPERWSYQSVPSNISLKILDNYVRYTFERACDQGKIVESEESATFNTGLLTLGHEEIFAVFTVSQHFEPTHPVSASNRKWYLRYWSRSGDRQLMEFLELPRMVNYWNETQDLVYDPRLQVQLNLDHIIRDNLNRFPTTLGGCVDADGVPTDLSGEIEETDLQNTVGASDLQIPLATRNALEGAMKHSIRLATRNYRVAVPQFYRGKIQLLLPLYLGETDKRPDLALTLERNGGWYRAATVLYPDWAYSHARLLARPNSEWLGGFREDLAA